MLAAERRIQSTRHKAFVLDLKETEIPEQTIGQINESCLCCGAKHFLKERPPDKQFTICCNKGKVKLPSFETNEYIKKLLLGEDPDSKHFLEHIRSYNSAFAFASVGAQIEAPPGFGPYCFRIHGQIYHRAGTLYPDNGNVAKFAQIYIFGESEANARRLSDPANVACKGHVMTKLLEIMKNNRFAQAYKMLHEVEKEERERSIAEGREQNKVSMAILQNRNDDQRRYNPQRCNEVAVVFSNIDGKPPLERDLLIHLRSDGSNNIHTTQRISILNKNLDAMTYPLLYPNAEQGWGEDMALFNPRQGTNARKRVTLKMFYSYLFSIRKDFNPFLSAGKLTQKYIVDAYVKAEANDLNYIRQHQKDLRAESYESLQDHAFDMNNDNENVIPGVKLYSHQHFKEVLEI